MSISTIPEIFQKITSDFSSKDLYVEKKNNQWVGISGSEIKSTVVDITYALKSFGVSSQDKVAILSTNSPRWCMCDYAIVCSGAATVTIYPTLISSQIEYIINDSGTKVIFVENLEQLDKIKEIWDNCTSLQKVIVLDDSLNRDDSREMNFSSILDVGTEFAKSSNDTFEDLVSNVNEDDLLTLIYTSGTTGTPKGVMLTHKNIISNLEGVFRDLAIDDKDSWLSFLPLSHVLERMAGHFSPFSVGAKVYFAENMEKIPENLVETKPTVVVSVPRLYEKMYSRIKEGLKTAPSIKRNLFSWATSVGTKCLPYTLRNKKLPFFLKLKRSIADKLIYSKVRERFGGNLRFFVSGGAALSQEIAEFFGSIGVTILEGYGLTETSPVLTSNIPGFIKFGAVGRPLHNVEIKIADDGEILARGPNIMAGYFNKEEETKKSIDKDGWFYTGDIGEFDDEGFLKITDRKKNILVTSGGKNIAPAPIEISMVNSPYIEQVVVIGDNRNFISALIVPAFEVVEKYLSDLDIKVSNNEELIKNSEVISLFEKQVQNAMTDFSNYEQVKKFCLIPRLFTLENGELTPSLKVIRGTVTKNFESEINKMYEN